MHDQHNVQRVEAVARMAIKKSHLYGSLWESCDQLRGGMDASQYKDYVLTLLFVKYVSDKYGGQPDALIEIPSGGSFCDMIKLKGDPEIGDKINKIISKLAEANDLKGVIDQADFNDETKLGRGKEMVDRLSKLIGIFEGLDFSANRAEGDDLLGDAYEYLMRHFAVESGKSKGQFYTPAEVSRVMAKVIGIEQAANLHLPTVYDPTCGSGSLLIKAATTAATPKLAIYGQEIDNATWALAKMNMFLHDFPDADLWRGNTLSDPHFKNNAGELKTFDFAVANPPFSQKNWTNGLDPAHDEFGRFEYGIPPAKNGDYAFLLHMIKSLKSTGKAAVILPHGVLFRGNAEADIRRNLVRRGLIKGIIGLPPNLFYGTGIPACVIVIDKENALTRKGIFMIDASKGYRKDGNKNRLREQDIRKIVDVFNGQVEIPRYSRLVPFSEIEANDYNLNIPRYIDSSEPEDLHDLEAHLRGGIPQRDVDALQPYWDVFPSLREGLFVPGDRPGYLTARLEPRRVKAVIEENPDFRAYAMRVQEVFRGWWDAHVPRLYALDEGCRPRAVIQTLADDLLKQFADLPLLDKYDVYQRLLDYWDETMQDDMYLIAAEGWVDAARPRLIITKKKVSSDEKVIKETPDLTVEKRKYKMDLLPPALVATRYFTAEKEELERLQAAQEAAASELEAFIDENSGEDGPLADATNEKGKVTQAGVKARIRDLRWEGVTGDDEELSALNRCLGLFEAKAKADKAAKAAQAVLNKKTLDRYGTLTEEEIKSLVIEDKWLAALQGAIDEEVRRVAQRLAGRIKELAERYAEPLPQIEREVAELNAKVAGHLRKMGLEWMAE